jgi:hypothetical protein
MKAPKGYDNSYFNQRMGKVDAFKAPTSTPFSNPSWSVGNKVPDFNPFGGNSFQLKGFGFNTFGYG